MKKYVFDFVYFSNGIIFMEREFLCNVPVYVKFNLCVSLTETRIKFKMYNEDSTVSYGI